LPSHVLDHPNVTDRVRIPMLPARRSLNLANSAAIAAYETWRQLGFAGAS
jgi:tRNA (cytidine/uridine-2'-O-)-methyltransferase